MPWHHKQKPNATKKQGKTMGPIEQSMLQKKMDQCVLDNGMNDKHEQDENENENENQNQNGNKANQKNEANEAKETKSTGFFYSLMHKPKQTKPTAEEIRDMDNKDDIYNDNNLAPQVKDAVYTYAGGIHGRALLVGQIIKENERIYNPMGTMYCVIDPCGRFCLKDAQDRIIAQKNLAIHFSYLFSRHYYMELGKDGDLCFYYGVFPDRKYEVCRSAPNISADSQNQGSDDEGDQTANENGNGNGTQGASGNPEENQIEAQSLKENDFQNGKPNRQNKRNQGYFLSVQDNNDLCIYNWDPRHPKECVWSFSQANAFMDHTIDNEDVTDTQTFDVTAGQQKGRAIMPGTIIHSGQSIRNPRGDAYLMLNDSGLLILATGIPGYEKGDVVQKVDLGWFLSFNGYLTLTSSGDLHMYSVPFGSSKKTDLIGTSVPNMGNAKKDKGYFLSLQNDYQLAIYNGTVTNPLDVIWVMRRPNAFAGVSASDPSSSSTFRSSNASPSFPLSYPLVSINPNHPLNRHDQRNVATKKQTEDKRQEGQNQNQGAKEKREEDALRELKTIQQDSAKKSSSLSQNKRTWAQRFCSR